MSGPRFILRSPAIRDAAKAAIDRAPEGYVVRIAEPSRTGEQNDKMWAMLTDVARAKPGGRRMTPDDWKVVFMHACGWECQFIEGLDGRPFPQGFRSSALTVRQMADLITFIQSWGDANGVRWSDAARQEAA